MEDHSRIKQRFSDHNLDKVQTQKDTLEREREDLMASLDDDEEDEEDNVMEDEKDGETKEDRR